MRRRNFFTALAAGIAGLFVGKGLKGADKMLTPPEFTMEDYKRVNKDMAKTLTHWKRDEPIPEEEFVRWEDRNTWGSIELTPPLHIKD